MRLLLTGAAGFIGFHAARRFLSLGYEVIGIDNLNDYYDVTLKKSRLDLLKKEPGFIFFRQDLADRGALGEIFKSFKFDRFVHLGAQAGVRYSLSNPHAYVDSNVVGTMNILEAARLQEIEHLVYASSSSVYGSNVNLPFSTKDRTDSPVSLYAATKKANELMAQTYSHLYDIPSTGLRFFTVYGPWGRPDMAYFKFAEAIIAGRTIDVYNNGDMARDFTYIDDIVDGIVAALARVPCAEQRHKVYNLGNSHPERLLDMIELLETQLGRVAKKNFMPMQPGDVYSTYADISDTTADLGFLPKVSLAQGLNKFAKWYRTYRNINDD